MSRRGHGMAKYLNARGDKILAARDEVAGRTGAELAQISLAWILAQPRIVAPIVSATSVPQLQTLVGSTRLKLKLSTEDLRLLTDAGK